MTKQQYVLIGFAVFLVLMLGVSMYSQQGSQFIGSLFKTSPASTPPY